MKQHFAICIIDDEPDLERGKVYRVLPDKGTERTRWLRVIDESGEDYLYPGKCFLLIELPRRVERLIMGRPSQRAKASATKPSSRRKTA